MDWSEAANVATAVGLFATAVGLALTAVQMRAAAKTARAQFVHELEVDAQRFQSIFVHLLPLGEPITEQRREALQKDELLVFSSINFFEKIQLMTRHDAVDMNTIDSLFAGRFFLLVHSPLVQSLVLLDQSYLSYFESIRTLYRDWYSYRMKRGLPVLLNENAIREFLDRRA